MKKVILVLVMAFALASFTQSNATIKENKPMDDTVILDRDCWMEADEAEEEYCGSPNCNMDYYRGYRDACLAAEGLQ